MQDLLTASAQMGVSLAFHIVFACAGVGTPLLMEESNGMWNVLLKRGSDFSPGSGQFPRPEQISRSDSKVIPECLMRPAHCTSEPREVRIETTAGRRCTLPSTVTERR